MSKTITIQGNVILFPDSGTPENWAPAVDAFAEAVQDALAGVVGPADVSPQVFTIDLYNPGSNVNIPNLTFSTTIVRSAVIKYSVYRSTDVASAYEAGTLTVVYNPNGLTGQKWEMGQQFIGDGDIEFNITDVGQVQMSTTALTGTNHVGKLSYTAAALLQNS